MSAHTHTSSMATISRTELTPECVHCGLCLQDCPTYIELGKEADSPRGRIYLMRAYEHGVMPFSESYVQHISACLDCRACESACPSGVPYGELVEKAREVIEHQVQRPFLAKVLRNFVFKRVFPSHGLLRLNFDLLRLYQLIGLQRLVRVSGILKLFPGNLHELEKLMPDIRKKKHHVKLGMVFPAHEKTLHCVGLMTGCLMNEVFGDINQATIRVLQNNGCEVVVPAGQGCCAALHCHAGITDMARVLALKNILAFEKAGVEAIISNASGCGAKLKEYALMFAQDAEFAGKAADFSRKVLDIASFLDALPELAQLGEIKARVAYDDPCHLLHAMKVSQPPRNLLKAIPGVELVELDHPDQCCGSAGIYNITQYELSMRILDRKIQDIKNAGVEILATGNPGCMLQIAHGLRKAGLNNTKVMHPVELLDQAYSLSRRN